MSFSDTTSLRSINIQDSFIRHRNFIAELTPILTDVDNNDASFITQSGLALLGGSNGAVSWEAVNFPGYYLRHQNFQLKLQPSPPFDAPAEEQQAFGQDATFFVLPGNADSSGNFRSFRPFNAPTRFLRHRDFKLFVDELDLSNNLDLLDSTFEIGDGFVPRPANE